MKNVLVLSLSLALGAAILGCGAGRGVPLRATTAAPIAGAYDWQAVRAATIRALEAERFRVDQEQGSRIVATYIRGRIMLQLAVDYTPQGYNITYLSSDGLNHREVEGVAFIGRRYDRIVRGLEGRIRSELDRPLREQRQHQLALAQAQRPVMYGPGYVAVAPAYGVAVGPGVAVAPAYGYGPSCEASLAATGHSQASNIFCGPDVDGHCAQALLYGGHSPTALMFCRGVEPSCAVAHLQGGGSPTALSRCRY